MPWPLRVRTEWKLKSTETVKKMGLSLYSLMLALWVGGMFLYTFLVTPIIFRAFSRDMASSIVDKLFPFYFPYNLILSVLSLAFFLLFRLQKDAGNKIALALITIAVVMNAFITFKLFPDVKKVKQAIVSFENTQPDSPYRKQFRRLHVLSLALNLLLLADGTALIVLTRFQ
jgi:uncharacterized membrane protein